jgi:hypothetical protein
MNINIRKYIALASLSAVSLSAASAATVTDNFNRPDTPLEGGNPNSIGANWTIQNGAWQILNQQLTDPTGGTPAVITWNSLQTYNTNAGSFMLSSTMACTLGSPLSMGLTFNFQDMNNYYAFRFDYGSGYAQWLVVSGGVESAIFTDLNAFTPVMGREYKVTVSSDQAYFASFEIYDTVTNSVVYSRGATEDGAHLFADGYGGLYSNFTHPSYTFDNFELTSVPEPSQIALIALASIVLFVAAKKRRESRVS